MPADFTKSDFVAGAQCQKRLYLSRHQPDLATPTAPGLNRRAEDGIEIGKVGRRLYPDGTLIDIAGDSPALQTIDAIKNGAQCLYEATFRDPVDGLFVRCDILLRLPTSANAWRLIEVKSGTSAKPEYVTDVAFQILAVRVCGVAVERVSILHINNQLHRFRVRGVRLTGLRALPAIPANSVSVVKPHRGFAWSSAPT
jgi:hypothetical protein